MSTDGQPDPIAVITGGGSGLGRAFAHELADAGFRIAVLGRTGSTLAETIGGMPADRALALVADVTDETAVAAAFDAVVARWGRVDVLVNNAGIGGPTGRLDEISVADVRATIETNLVGAVICAREAVRVMRAQSPSGGRIINNGSISAHVPRPLSTAYAVSKHAITGLTRSLALDGRADGIACGQIDIGNAATAMTGGFVEGALQADGARRAEPVFDVADAARAVRYMATLPPGANTLFLTVTATDMPFVGRG